MACLLNRSPDVKTRYSIDYPCYSWQCSRCGWNSEEHERRISGGLTRGEDGLKHFSKTKYKITEECDNQ